MLPVTEDGESGWQVCNLTEGNGGACTTEQEFYEVCESASVLGTLQAGYTDFKYLTEASRRITEREALIGVSITGWMNSPDLLFNTEVQRKGAEIVKQTNAKVSKMLGINQAARTTCVKPSGNASVILGTASGIHGEHSPLYFRNVQMNEQDEVLALIKEVNPKMVEKSVWSSNGTDYVVSFPVQTKEGSVYKKDLMGVKQLEYVKIAQQNWVEHGTNEDLCTDKRLRHNVSNTISVDNWDEVEEYIYQNRQWFAGISLLSAMGDRAYVQAPFTEVFTAEQIFKQYGQGCMFASGVIVDALHAFNNNLWIACDTVMGFGEVLEECSETVLKRDWVRRAKKYALNYFDNDLEKMTFCLKDCYNLHKWLSLEKSMQKIDFASQLSERKAVDADTLQGQACSGGACEIVF
jgi:ribonucleoside-diphosphate reductase alpha chain